MAQGTIVKVAGPLIMATGMADVRMYDVVRVSQSRLVGEVMRAILSDAPYPVSLFEQVQLRLRAEQDVSRCRWSWRRA